MVSEVRVHEHQGGKHGGRWADRWVGGRQALHWRQREQEMALSSKAPKSTPSDTLPTVKLRLPKVPEPAPNSNWEPRIPMH